MARAVEVIKVEDLQSKEYSYLYQLNFRGGSPMQRRLSMARHRTIEGHVAICKEGSEILGWCLIWHDDQIDIHTPVAYFYVKRKYRRKGVGRELMQAACKFGSEHYKRIVSVWVHDDVSQSFFSNTTGRIMRYESE